MFTVYTLLLAYMSSSTHNFTAILEAHAAKLLAEGKPEEALRIAEAAVASARTAADDDAQHMPMLVRALDQLAEVKRDKGDTDEALKLYAEAIEKGVAAKVENEVLAPIRAAYASLLDSSGAEDQAVPVYEEAIKGLEAMEPPDRVTAARLRNNLAMSYKRQNKLALSEQHYLAAIEALEAALGRETEDVSSLYNNLGGLYYAAGFPDQAKTVFLEAMEIRLKLLGSDHPDMAQSHSNLATVQYELGDNQGAQASFEQALSILESHIQDEAKSYEAVGQDYIGLLGAIEEDAKAAALQKRMKEVLKQVRA